MELKNVLNSDEYISQNILGDIKMKKLVDRYISERDAVLKNKDVDKERVAFYEPLLIKDEVKPWWHHYSNTYITSVIRFYGTLRKDNTPMKEYSMMKKFLSSLPMYIRIGGMYGMDNISKNKELIEYFGVGE